MKSIKIIIEYLKTKFWLAMLAPLCVLIEVGAELVQPKLMSEIVNEGVIAGDHSLILSIGVKMLLLTLLGVLAGMLSIYAAGQVSYSFGAEMRKNMFSRIQRFSFENVDRLQVGSLITRITDDVNKVQNVIQASMRLLFRAPFLFVGAIVMVFMLDLRMSYILMVLMPLLVFIIVYLLRKSYPLFSVVQGKLDKFNTIISESLSGVRVVKAYVREDEEKRRFAEANKDYIAASLKVSTTIMFMMPLMSLVMNGGVVAVLWFGEYEVQRGNLNVGDIMACTNYLTQVLMSLMMAQHVIMSITQAEASMNRINEVLETEEIINEVEVEEETMPEEASLEFKNVYFSYESNDTYQLNDISFKLNAGETLAIIGGTGSGKSSIINLIPRFYDPQKGEIFIGGKPLSDIDRRDLQEHIGIVMQSTQLFSGTIADNLRMGKEDATPEEMKEALRKAQILDFVEGLENGLEHHIEQDATNISGGQKQRISIARTLIKNPRILILDDSLSAVDLITEAAIRKELVKLRTTKIIIAQRISSIKNADKILMVDDGRVSGFGSHAELYESNKLYKEIYDSQVESANEGKEVSL